MTTSQRRIALLAGASISALGLSSPALADPWYPAPRPSDAVANGTYPGATTTEETIVICDLDFDDAPPLATDPCFFGTKFDGAGPSVAIAGNVFNQTVVAPTGPVTMLNDDVAEIGAVAMATAGLADARLSDAIDQRIVGNADYGTATITNDDTLLINALAVAYGTSPTAIAINVDAIDQIGEADADNVTLNIVNNGTLHIAATAVANGETGAYAYAYNQGGILQDAEAGGYGTAAVSLANNGDLHIGAYANATATAGYASATAVQLTGIQQRADSFGDGAAIAALSQAGELNVDAIASATGGTSAYANAFNFAAIDQRARANGDGNAYATITMAGGTVQAVANASATAGSAFAYAYATQAVRQRALTLGGGDAAAAMANSGTLTINAIANATAGDGYAQAVATNLNAIDQRAIAGVELLMTGGDAFATMTNTGGITVAASAFASGSSAGAFASVSDAVRQSAMAFGEDANATAVMVNDGSITIQGVASAAATEGFAFASATVSDAVRQDAIALNGGDASASLTGAGTIDIGAFAQAVSTDDGATALANVGGAIVQIASAVGGGDATAYMTQSGINAAATALAAGSGVYADAELDVVVFQSAYATAGNASASMVLNGDNSFVASASANATDENATASATIAIGVRQEANAEGGGDATASLANTGTLTIGASAVSLADETAFAIATADGVLQQASARGQALVGTGEDAELVGGNAYATMTNAGTIAVFASATATGATASANAMVTYGVFQSARALGEGETPVGGDAFATMSNEGTIAVNANALAYATAGTATASADVMNGVRQLTRSTGGDALSTLDNVGYVSVAANATAIGGSRVVGIGDAQTVAYGSAFATAAVGNGILQEARAIAQGLDFVANPDPYATGLVATDADVGDAAVVLNNDGAISVVAGANATGGGNSVAVSTVGAGVHQRARGGTIEILVGEGDAAELVEVGGNASAFLTNGGSVTVAASAVATGTAAAASALAGLGVAQFVTAELGFGSAYLTNAGTVALAASATANGTSTATAIAGSGVAVYQEVAAATGYATMLNAGTVTSTANALAVAAGDGAGGGAAFASAHAAGMGQLIMAGTGTAYMTNSGTLNVGANATASGYATASAAARATGAFQTADGDIGVNFTNNGVINVNASALAGTVEGGDADAVVGNATATAIGYEGLGITGGEMMFAVANYGTMNVTASAVAPDYASALAQGIVVMNEPTIVVDEAGEIELVGNPLGGTIFNGGTLNVVASASGGAIGEYATPGSAATATGILVAGGVNNMEITNTGDINVDAITANGGAAEATGIRVVANGTVMAGATDVTTINNSGNITARESTDGGATFLRGMAIDVAEAPNQTVINLLGGNIFGNIDVAEGDEINVTTDLTVFNGIINPECMPAGGPGDLELDNEDQNLCGQGSLTIDQGGSLQLVIDDQEGPSYVFVEEFTVGADGTIIFDLPGATGAAAIGTYPQIFTNVANLDGTLIANIDGTLFETTTYENVIDALERNGQFDQCILNGIPGDSVLLEFGCVYDNANNVDLRLTRTAFNDVPGLNRNGVAVGEGLECIYDVTLTGGIADLFGDLFLITDEAEFNEALNQLAGIGTANYLQSFPSLGVHYNDLLDHATSCEIPALAGSVIECRASSPIHVWGQLDYQKRRADGDAEAGSYRSGRFTGLVGIDAQVGGAAILGVSVGKVNNHVDERRYGDNIDADGLQVGAYGVFDPGAFYVKAMGTYSWFDGDSRRDIDFTPFGGTFGGTTRGDPDVKMLTLGLHGGARLAMGGNSTVTPFLNLDYVNARLDEYIETGLEGANLHIDDGGIKRTFLTGGVKYATQIGGVVPEAKIGYRHRFGDRRATVSQAFLCQTDTECEFDIVSASEKRGTILAGLSIGGKVGPVDLRLGYEGEFNSDIRSHAGNFRVILPLGGRPAPAPVVAPPPPPPPRWSEVSAAKPTRSREGTTTGK